MNFLKGNNYLSIIYLNSILIRVYPRKRGCMAGFIPLWQQFLLLPLSILLDSWHPFPRNQHSYSPSPLASSTSFLVVLASSCPSLQIPVLFSKHAHHPSSTHVRTISLHSPLPSKLSLFPPCIHVCLLFYSNQLLKPGKSIRSYLRFMKNLKSNGSTS